MEVIVDVKDCFNSLEFLEILAESVFEPTEERLNSRAENYMGDPFVKIFALERNGKNVGIVVLETSNPKQIEILDIAVKRNMQQNGIGRKLIDFCSRECKAELIIAETDDDAVGFYEKLGFTIDLLGDKYNVGINRYLCKLMIN